MLFNAAVFSYVSLNPAFNAELYIKSDQMDPVQPPAFTFFSQLGTDSCF